MKCPKCNNFNVKFIGIENQKELYKCYDCEEIIVARELEDLSDDELRRISEILELLENKE